MQTEYWMATADEQRKIINVIHMAEAMSDSRRGVTMAVTKDLQVRPMGLVKQKDVVEYVRHTTVWR